MGGQRLTPHQQKNLVKYGAEHGVSVIFLPGGEGEWTSKAVLYGPENYLQECRGINNKRMSMIKLKSLLNEKILLKEMRMPPGFGTNDMESIDDFVAGKEISNEPKSNLDFSKIGEVEGEKFMGAQTRDFPDPEVQSHLQRIASKEKSPGDKSKYPYIHRSNIVDDDGKVLDLNTLKKKFSQRPDKILQQNAKIQKSGSKNYVFFNISLPAFKGLILDEASGEFKIIDTCPKAGACKVYCYAKKGGYVQWKATSLLQTRMLNFLLNDWQGFKNKLVGEIQSATNKYKNKGYEIVLRWHDSGDFMSEKYLDMAFEIAKTTPDVTHYAYTKMIGMVSAASKPKNFVFNLSQGSSEDELLDKVKDKRSVVVPAPLFKDHVERDEQTGGWKFKSDSDLRRVKEKISAKYNFPKEDVITYAEMMDIPYNAGEDPEPKYHVIVKSGDGDDAAMRKDVQSVLLFIH